MQCNQADKGSYVSIKGSNTSFPCDPGKSFTWLIFMALFKRRSLFGQVHIRYSQVQQHVPIVALERLTPIQVAALVLPRAK
jgi:hypothetical protein